MSSTIEAHLSNAAQDTNSNTLNIIAADKRTQQTMQKLHVHTKNLNKVPACLYV